MKLIHFYLIAIILFLLFPVSDILAEACTPDSGYDYCYQYTGQPGCFPKIQFTNPRDITGAYQSPMVQKMYINVKAGNSYKVKVYAYRGLTSWDQVSCGSTGCNGTLIGSSEGWEGWTGQYVVGTTGDTNPEYAAFVVWVWDAIDPYEPPNYGGQWCWAWVGGGWVGSPNYWPIEIVECREDAHCTAQEGGVCQADYTCSWEPITVAPAVVTRPAVVDVENNSAVLYGEVVDLGYLDLPVLSRMISWGDGELSFIGFWENTIYATGAFGLGEFNSDQLDQGFVLYGEGIPVYPDNLEVGTVYYFKAMAGNAEDTGIGGDKQFVIYTTPGDQMSFTTLSDDATRPTAEVRSPEAGSWQKEEFDSTFRYTDTGGSGLSLCQYRVVSSGGETVAWTSAGTCSGDGPVDLTKNITVGPTGNCRHEGEDKCTIYVRATDGAGNTTSPPGSRSFNIDWALPVIEFPD